MNPITAVAKGVPTKDSSKKQMPFLNHLEELRRRLFKCLLAIGICFSVCYFYSEWILQFLMMPVLSVLDANQAAQLHFTGLLEPFLTHLKVSLFAALFFSCPVLFYQIWRFAAPGLYLSERAAIGSLVVSSTLTFVLGLAFAYYIVFPVGFEFFLSFTTTSLQPVLTISQYTKVTLRLLLGFGLVFELPVVVVLLSLLGVLDGKRLAKFWRYALILTAIFSAAFTPPDLMSMALMMVPLNILYGISILLSFFFSRKKNLKN